MDTVVGVRASDERRSAALPEQRPPVLTPEDLVPDCPPLRILHLAEAFGGGLMEMTVALAEASSRRGHDVLIGYGIRPETPADVRDRIDARIEVRQLPWTRRSPGAQLRAAREIRRLIRAWRPDIVHLHSSFAGLVGSMVIDERIPLVYSPHAFASALPEAGKLRASLFRAGERRTCRRVAAVGAVSSSEAALAWDLGASHVLRVRNGIRELDPDVVHTRSADDPPPDPARIVAAGRTVPQRLPEACAGILSQVRDVAEVEWLGGGGGARGVEGRQALEAAGIPLSGWLPRPELLGRLRDATAYLHWTAWDGLPLSVLEAIALDVVVVASDIPPNREILGEDSVCASEEEAVALLRRVVEDPLFAEEMRMVQRARREAFSADHMATLWHRAYERVLAPEPDAMLVPVPVPA